MVHPPRVNISGRLRPTCGNELGYSGALSAPCSILLVAYLHVSENSARRASQAGIFPGARSGYWAASTWTLLSEAGDPARSLGRSAAFHGIWDTEAVVGRVATASRDREAEAGEVTRLWLAGSFASGKLDPSDIDTTYLLRADVFDRLDRDALAALDDLTDKAWCVDNAMRIDAYLVRLPDEMPFWQMRPSIFGARANEAFRDLGLYDEVWQCVRPSPLAGSHHGQSRQGYVEVLL